MNDDDLINRIESLGRTEAPPVDGAFANRLESDLRELHGAPASRGFGIPDLLLRPAAVIAALVVVIGVVAIVRSSDNPSSVQIVAAAGTTVSIPGAGSIDAGTGGLELPEGTRIQVDASGSAIVAGVVLEAGSTALVVDGRIEVIESPGVTATTTTSVPAVDSTRPLVPGPTVTTDPSSASSVAPTTDGTGVSTIAPETTIPDTTIPATTVASTAPPVTAASTSTVANTAVATTTGPTTTRESTVETNDPIDTRPVLELEIGPVRNKAATLFWTASGNVDRIARWEVRVVRDDETRTIAVIRVADARRLRVEILGPRIGYQVRALGQAGAVLAESNVVRPAAAISPDG